MNEILKNGVLKYDSILPEDFDGTFRFSNPSDEDFIGKWGGKEYVFPAKSTVALVIPEHTPLEIQNIRKKFAKDLAIREFYNSKEYKKMSDQEGEFGRKNFSSIHQAASYTDTDLIPYIQACLTDLPATKLVTKKVETIPLEEKLNRDDDGSLITTAIDSKTSLKAKALNAS
jgi:hypothetical protein